MKKTFDRFIEIYRNILILHFFTVKRSYDEYITQYEHMLGHENKKSIDNIGTVTHMNYCKYIVARMLCSGPLL
jgi:purine-cytosine permease-like protein